MSATLVADIYDRAERTELAVRLAALEQITQIGRASCRERVCHNV